MSSIDKYVEGEARSCNPNVRVEKIFGRINGYIGGTKIFSIADREGFLDDDERSTIRESIKEYEAEQKERERRERIRIENERIAARNAFASSVSAAKNRLRESFSNVRKLSDGAASTLSFLSSELEALNEYSISSYVERVKSLKLKLKSSEEKLESEYKARVSEVEQIQRTTGESATREEYVKKQNEVSRINIGLYRSGLPNAEIEQFKGEVEKLKEALSQIKKIENELNKVKRDGLVGSIASSALKEIRQYNIRSLDDVNSLLVAVQNHLVEIRNLNFQQRSQDTSDRIALLNGILKSCSYCREYLINQNYEAANNRVEIVEKANSVLGIYSELDTAAYTTCSREKIKEAYESAQSVLIGSASDVQTLEHLKRLQEEGFIYKRDDLLQTDNHADYLKKQKEMIERGVPLEEIEAFDPFNYTQQSARLNQKLLDLDIQEGIDQTRTSFMMAWKVMEDMGYRLLYHNMGGEGRDALACEGIFVKPGCDGVVWQTVVSGCNVSRRIIGLERTNGMVTPIQRVKEVARISESDGDVEEFFSRYSEEGGGMLTVKTDVYSDSEQCEQAIDDNGCFKLTEEGERCFNKLVQTDDADAKKKWSSRIPSGQMQTKIKSEGTSRYMREEQSQRAEEYIVAQRAKK